MQQIQRKKINCCRLGQKRRILEDTGNFSEMSISPSWFGDSFKSVHFHPETKRTAQLKYMQLYWSQLWPSKAVLKTKIQVPADGASGTWATGRPSSGNREVLPLGWVGLKLHSLSDCLKYLQAISGISGPFSACYPVKRNLPTKPSFTDGGWGPKNHSLGKIENQ